MIVPSAKITPVILLSASLLLAACNQDAQPKRNEGGESVMSDIKEVHEKHTAALMKIDGVVGTAIGALGDGSPCILVFVKEDSSEMRKKFPLNFDGYPVVIQVTGEIGPQ